MPKFLRPVEVLLRLVIRRFNEERCVQVAGSLTFTTLLALVPLITMAFAMISAFPMFEDISNQLKIFVLMNMVPEVGGKIITVYMQQFADNATGLTAIGIVFIGVTALLLMVTVERVFNVIWRVARARPVAQRLFVYWAALTIGPVLIGGSLSLTSWLVSHSMGLVTTLPRVDIVLLRVLPPVLNAVAFALLYVALPNRTVRPFDALTGGIVAAAAFELMKRGFGIYVTQFPTYTLVYGAFAAIPIFLLWVYLSWLVVLLGAVVVAVLPRWRAGAGRPETEFDARFFSALRLLREVAAAHARGELVTSATLMAMAGLADEDLEELLERMMQAGWVARTATGAWVLARDTGEITVADVYRAFVFRSQPQAGDDAAAFDVELARVAHQLARRVEEVMDVSLKTLFAGEPGPESPLPAADPVSSA